MERASFKDAFGCGIPKGYGAKEASQHTIVLADELRSLLLTRLRNSNVFLAFDGGKMNGFSHVNFTIGDMDGNVFFYRSIRVTAQDAQALESIVKEVVDELSEKGVNVFCAVADNASAYQKALAMLAGNVPEVGLKNTLGENPM